MILCTLVQNIMEAVLSYPFQAIATRGSKQQVVYVESSTGEHGSRMFECSYGVVSSHECYMAESNLRLLTAEESTMSVFRLPQQFYQSGPPGCKSMDAHKLN